MHSEPTDVGGGALAAQFALLVENSDDFIATGDFDDTIHFVNGAGRRMVGIASLEAACDAPLSEYFMPEDLAQFDAEIMPAVERDGKWSGEFRFRHFTTGVRVPIWCSVIALRNADDTRVGLSIVGRDLRPRRRIDIGLQTLAETSAAMFRSLNFAETLQNVASAATRRFATYCVIDMFDDTGVLRLAATSHADPAFADVVANMAKTRDMGPSHVVNQAANDGKTSFVPRVPDDWVQSTGMREGADHWIGRLMPGSIICVPFRSASEERIIGAISFGVDRRDQRGAFTSDDLRFAEEIAQRAGIAYDHARAYQRERRIAVTLQAASLPKTLPTLPGARISADYRPGSSEATIGGDWYDAFVLDDGRLAVVIGDVVGHGLKAATTMSGMRRSMRAAASLIPTPAAMLRVAETTIRDDESEMYATALAGILDLAEGTFTFASAGHPPPILRYADGRVEELGSAGVLLGAGDLARVSALETTIAVPAGATLVLYTDGLTEATRDVVEGHERLHAAVSADAASGDVNPARSIIDRVLGDQPAADDVAVLVVATISAPARSSSESMLPVSIAQTIL